MAPPFSLRQYRKAQESFARLCAEPTDDSPSPPMPPARRGTARLVAPPGHPTRAALLRAQLELAARPDADPAPAALAELEHDLLAANAALWRREELPDLPGITWGDFERGFSA